MKFIKWFEEVGTGDVGLVGGKNASLGEMIRNLTEEGVNVPSGFAVTAEAYKYVLEAGDIQGKIRDTLADLDTHDMKNLAERGSKIRALIKNAGCPAELEQEIRAAYREMEKRYGEGVDVAVRSSATAEDLPSIAADEPVLVKFGGKTVYQEVEGLYEAYNGEAAKNNGNGAGVRMEVPAMEEGKEVKWKRVDEIYRHPANAATLFKITTKTGREIKVSPDHSLIVLDRDFKVRTKSIQDLEPEDKIPVVRRLPDPDPDPDPNPNPVPVPVPVPNPETERGASRTARRHLDVLEYLKSGEKSDEAVTDEAGKVKLKRSGNWKIQNGLPRNLPLTEEFLYFLGIYAAEGSTYKQNEVSITNSSPEIRKRVTDFLEGLGLWHEGRKINKGSVRVYCPSLVSFLHRVAGAPLNQQGKGRHCRTKRVPDFVFGLERELVGAFLRGCFDSDGDVGKNAINYSSLSKDLIGGVAVLLERLGVKFYLRRKLTRISIPYKEAERFSRLVGFECVKKAERLNALAEDYKGKEKHFDFIEVFEINPDLFRDAVEERLPREEVEESRCPLCSSVVGRTSRYKGKTRFYCKKCGKAFYEDEVEKERRFEKGATPWNKGRISRRIGARLLRRVAENYGAEEVLEGLNGAVMWDGIKEIEPIEYSGYVYDFVVPGVENFAAGMGGIITHNTASFAGQQETYLNVRGEDELVEKVMECFASLFTNRAISYRVDKGFDHLSVFLSVGVQKMARSDLACSGVMFSIDTESGFSDAVYITGAYGLGENVVQGAVNPDQFYVFKPTLRQGFRPIVEKKLGSKRKKMVYKEAGAGKTGTGAGARKTGTGTRQEKVGEEDRKKFVLTDDEVLRLARWACIIEEHYGTPMDIEWAKDGTTGELFVVQARPETVHSQKDLSSLETYVLEEEVEKLKEAGRLLVEGEAVGHKIGYGEVNVIENARDILNFKPGQVLVTDMTDPDWEPIMKVAGAIVTNRGGRTCHAAIISRELGIPCVIGTVRGTRVLKGVKDVTVDCSEGTGRIYEGRLKYRVEKLVLDNLPRPGTRIMMNAAVPENAFIQGQIPNDGVGLAREEFIINSYIGIHPLALLEYEDLKRRAEAEGDKKLARVVKEIEKRSASYEDKVQFFVDNLARGIAKIAAGFYPNEVIVRLSDFKTNEYANLLGGYLYEPAENNPMLGWRGASRYYDEKFKPAFGLECRAIKKVREEMGLTNVKVMIPFCRTPEEGRKVIKTMAEFGLRQGENGLEVYVMCEIPSNVILADEFAEVFDGFSIGSNDLTQLTLGLDRDSDLVAGLFDERNEAVKRLVKQVIKVAHEHEPRRKVGICGQAPSDFPEFAAFLVECGIDSISLNPDAIISTRLNVAEVEKRLEEKQREEREKENEEKRSG